MTSLEVITFKKTIEDYVKSVDMPMEVKRLVIKEIYEDVHKKALEEVMSEISEREENNGNTSSTEKCS